MPILIVLQIILLAVWYVVPGAALMPWWLVFAPAWIMGIALLFVGLSFGLAYLMTKAWR